MAYRADWLRARLRRVDCAHGLDDQHEDNRQDDGRGNRPDQFERAVAMHLWRLSRVARSGAKAGNGQKDPREHESEEECRNDQLESVKIGDRQTLSRDWIEALH